MVDSTFVRLRTCWMHLLNVDSQNQFHADVDTDFLHGFLTTTVVKQQQRISTERAVVRIFTSAKGAM